MTIDLKTVGLVRSGQTILHGITARLDERRIGVIGLNGSGKSSLARLIAGLMQPTSGSILIDGLDTKADAKALKGRTGFVFQNPLNQIVLPIVADDVAFGLTNRGVPRKEAVKQARAMLDRLGLLSLAERPAHELSGGEVQLVALAAILVMQPGLIVFDEPTTALDLRNARRVAAAIDKLDARAVVVTHDLALARSMDRVLLLHEGRLHFDGDPAEAARRLEALAEVAP
ncbi:Biotin transport ATP-binding protein BioM [Hartmannibacter diazotrophicus]|uniref:Biotin transport ATP-binding protein BioM n=1 Tax=Hartmannibacter diazotrophicus TaxID=1482074 RepID=A0A2C9D2H9_9HYPH|nr:ABC transporter ATP-binding protein [Hartmannibacter diazotrophicus]SON54537.1 Biotin transport ATP-binding protein BioM [Hartmannibacter diazotrophicus]